MTCVREPEKTLLTFPSSGTDEWYRRLNGVPKADRTSGMVSLVDRRCGTLDMYFGLRDCRRPCR